MVVLIGIFLFVDGSFIFGLFINIVIFFIFCLMCIVIDKVNDFFGGVIVFFYVYVLLMGIGLVIIVKIIYVVFFSI